MPRSVSAKKRVRQNRTRRDYNSVYKSRIRTQMKKVLAAVAAKDAKNSEAEVRMACVLLDRAASKHVLHRNAAARYKSRLARKVHALAGAGARS
ncbi:MAG: 30S ribosomal protein S20 [Planctomycetes bacterium]|nr:30S ribosomal protein S20 [Planctomycetota bacterium]